MNKGKLGNEKRLKDLSESTGRLVQEKKVFGRISKIFTDAEGNWSQPLVQVRYEGKSIDPGHSGLIGDENTWIYLGDDPLDIALRFGEPQAGDRVEIIYKYKPWLGKAYMITEDKNTRPDGVGAAAGAVEIEQESFIIFPPGD